MKAIFRMFSAALLLFLSMDANAADDPKLVMEEFMVPAVDPGISLYVRNKHPQGVTNFPGDKILLYVHGATYPSETAFDLQLNGMSWMDYIARHGYDVYLVDLRGYGRSTRPPEMDQPAADRTRRSCAPTTAVKDVGAAVDFILKRRGVSKINLLGWSWGTTHHGLVHRAEQRQGEQARALRAAVDPHHRIAGADRARSSAPTARCRGTPPRAAGSRACPRTRRRTLIPPGWFEAWADATFATDPVGSKQTPPVLRAPNGVVQDGREYWSAGKPLYDPADIRVPTFLAHAEWDADLPSYMLYAYFAKLTNAPYKRYVEIGEGTHTVIMEKNRMQLFQAVQQFLDERLKPND